MSISDQYNSNTVPCAINRFQVVSFLHVMLVSLKHPRTSHHSETYDVTHIFSHT